MTTIDTTDARERRAEQRKEQRARLPKWAQQEIDRLERDLDDARAKLSAGPEDSDTFADPYSEQARRPLGQGPTIMFKLGERNEIRCRVEHDHRGRAYLDVNASSGRLAILPRAGNSCEMYGEEIR